MTASSPANRPRSSLLPKGAEQLQRRSTYDMPSRRCQPSPCSLGHGWKQLAIRKLITRCLGSRWPTLGRILIRIGSGRYLEVLGQLLLAAIFVHEDETLLLVNGYHRVVSAPRVGRTTVRAAVRVGTKAEAPIQAEGLDGNQLRTSQRPLLRASKELHRLHRSLDQGIRREGRAKPSLANPILIADLAGPPGRCITGVTRASVVASTDCVVSSERSCKWVTASQSFLTSVTH